jgi:hypothetical protein
MSFFLFRCNYALDASLHRRPHSFLFSNRFYLYFVPIVFFLILCPYHQGRSQCYQTSRKKTTVVAAAAVWRFVISACDRIAKAASFSALRCDIRSAEPAIRVSIRVEQVILFSNYCRFARKLAFIDKHNQPLHTDPIRRSIDSSNKWRSLP